MSHASATLLIRFACSICQHSLQIPLQSLSKLPLPCPRCGATLEAPELSDRTEGWDVVSEQAGRQAKPSHATCPRCSHSLKVTPAAIGQSRKCPVCRTRLKFQMTADEPAHSGEELPRVRDEEIFSDLPGERQPVASGYAPPPRGRQAAAKAAPPLADFDDDDEDRNENVPPLIIDNEHSHLPARRESERSNSLLTSPRTLFRVLYPIIQFGPFALYMLPAFVGVSANSEGWVMLGVFGFLWMFPFWRWCQRFTWLVVSSLVTGVRCPHCSIEYPAVGRWGCSCGFADHRQSHILRFKCPMCKRVLGHTQCERCQTTIRVR